MDKESGAQSATFPMSDCHGTREHLQIFGGHVSCRFNIRPTRAELVSWHCNISREIMYKTEAAVNQYEMLSLVLFKKRFGRTHKDGWGVRVGLSPSHGSGWANGLIVLATAKFGSDGWGRKWQNEASQIGHLNTNVKYYEAEDGYSFVSTSLLVKGCGGNDSVRI